MKNFSHQEPAHPMQLKLQEDLLSIYRQIREKFQNEIDKAFDRTASQIGYVINTAIPVTLKIEKSNAVIIIPDEFQFKDTILEQEMKGLMDGMRKMKWGNEISAGEFKMYLFWYEALKLRLRTEWMEPVHYRNIFQDEALRYRELQQVKERTAVLPEPAHFFNPLIPISDEELILVNVIDQVYPELQLIEKISKTRLYSRKLINPEVMEPVHIKPGAELGRIRELLSQIDVILRQLGH
jgi:hypothetical protein